MSNVTRRRSSELQESVVIVKHSSSSDYLSAFQQRNLAHSQSLNSISKQKSFGYQNKPEVTRQNSTEFVTKTTKRLHETLDNRARVVTRSIRKESYTVQTNQVIDDLLTCPVCQFQMTINSQRLFEIQERLENLLTEKKVLNSKIVADSFKNFQSQVTKIRNRQPADIKPALRRLENSLKSEGAYKNVKAGFEGIKLEVTEVVDRSEFVTDKPPKMLTVATKVPVKAREAHQENKKPTSRATTVTLSHQRDRTKRQSMPSIQRPVIKEESSTLSPRTTQTKPLALDSKDKDVKSLNHQDIQSLNKTISKLFNHLDIDKPTETPVKVQQPKGQQKTTSSGPTIAVVGKAAKPTTKRDVEDIQELINKLKLFEQELQRKRSREQDELQTLQSELQKLKSQLKEQNGQLERIRGTHMIANKAKGKHVELLEERHMTEKRDIEDKLHALEKNIKLNLDMTREKDQFAETKQDVIKLKVEIEKLHKLVDSTGSVNGDFTTRKGRTKTRVWDEDDSPYDIGDMLHKVAVIGNEMQGLKDSKVALQRYVKELNNWETNFEEVEKELETFYREAMPDISIMDTDSEPTLGTHSSNTSGKAFQESSTKTPPAKVKMKKLHTLYANKKRKLEDSERLLRQSHQELDLTKARLAKLIDSVDQVYTDYNKVYPEGDSSATSGTMRGRHRRTSESSSLSDKPEMDDESKQYDMAMVRVNELGVWTKKYDTMLQHSNKDMKEFENDLRVIQRHIANIHDKVSATATRDLSDLSRADSADLDTVSATCQDIVRKLVRVEKGLKYAAEENTKLKGYLEANHKAELLLADVVTETEGLCEHLHVAVKQGDNPGIKIKANLNECRMALRKLKDQESDRSRSLEEIRKETSKLTVEVHKLYLFTDYGVESTQSDEDVGTDSPDKRNVSKFQDVTKQLIAIHERFTVIRSMKEALHIALSDLEKHASSSESDAKDQIMKLKMQITIREQELKDQHGEINRLRDETEHNKSEIARLQLEVNERFKSTLSVSDEEKVYLRNKIDDVQRRLDIAEGNLNEAMKEKYNLLTRLSMMAGAKLTDDNPSIFDLSDPHRPTKLAEMFSSLYDDEWTNAFETLRNQFSLDETEAIQHLLSVVTGSFSFCETAARGQLTDVHKTLFMLQHSRTTDKAVEEKTKLLSPEDRKQIKDIRKWCAPQAAEVVIQLFVKEASDKSWTKQQLDACGPYVNNCVTLCWLMNVQTPPVYMVRDVESGDPFDATKQRHYTRPGTVVDFVVWPTLQMTKNGAILGKGVVQTRRQKV